MLQKVKTWAAGLILRFIGSRGYELTRPRFHEENAIDVRALLAEPIEREKGCFVVLQIGANDGIANDPIREAVLSREWELYAVEPMPAVFEKLKRNYGEDPRFHYIRCAVGHEDGEAELYFLEQDEDVEGPGYDQFTSFSRDVIEQHWRLVPDIRDKIRTATVPVLTFSSLMTAYEVPTIDLLQIDTEGFDYEIIKMAFAAGVFPAVLAFEWVNLSQEDMWSCRCDLIAHGYRWIMDKGDVIASRSDVTGR